MTELNKDLFPIIASLAPAESNAKIAAVTDAVVDAVIYYLRRRAADIGVPVLSDGDSDRIVRSITRYRSIPRFEARDVASIVLFAISNELADLPEPDGSQRNV